MSQAVTLNERYLANCDWQDEPSLEKAKAFRTVLMTIQALRPSQMQKGQASQMAFGNEEAIQKQLDEVSKFLASENNSGYQYDTYCDVRNFRR